MEPVHKLEHACVGLGTVALQPRMSIVFWTQGGQVGAHLTALRMRQQLVQ